MTGKCAHQDNGLDLYIHRHGLSQEQIRDEDLYIDPRKNSKLSQIEVTKDEVKLYAEQGHL